MKDQPIFFNSNPNRNPEFALETTIRKTKNGLVAEKRATTPQAEEHLNRMPASYDLLKNLYEQSKLINVVPATAAKKGAVTFPFVEGRALERILVEGIIYNDDDLVTASLNKLIKIIYSLPETTCNPAKNDSYAKVFGSSFNKKTACAAIGLIDLNLDNIIVDKNNKWHLIDYEWVFDFPVSKKHLVQRMFWWLIIRHQEIFKYHAHSLECMKIADNVLVPKVLYKNYEGFVSDFGDLIVSENNFQKYTRSTAKPKNIDFYGKIAEYIPEPAGIAAILQERYELFKKVGSVQNKYDMLRKQLEASSPTPYKRLRSKAASAKRRLFKRQ